MPFRFIPIMPMDFSVTEQEYSSTRQQFLADMKTMEEEMSRFCREFSTFQESLPAPEGEDDSNHNLQLHSWLDEVNSPLVEEDGDTKKLKLKFDVSQYQPEEVTVKVANNKLMVYAKHDEKTDEHKLYHEYHRQFMLPNGVDESIITSSLSKDGVLTVEVPLPASTDEQDVPIAIE